MTHGEFELTMHTTDSDMLDAGSDQVDQHLSEPPEFSTVMLLLHATCILNAQKSDSKSEVFTSKIRGCEERSHNVSLAPLEALAAILVQHAEVIAVSYISPTATVVSMHFQDPISIDGSNIPDSILPNLISTKVNPLEPMIYLLGFSAVTNSTELPEHQVNHSLSIVGRGKNLWVGLYGHYRWAYVL